jgi:hypothetical protein
MSEISSLLEKSRTWSWSLDIFEPIIKLAYPNGSVTLDTHFESGHPVIEVLRMIRITALEHQHLEELGHILPRLWIMFTPLLQVPVLAQVVANTLKTLLRNVPFHLTIVEVVLELLGDPDHSATTCSCAANQLQIELLDIASEMLHSTGTRLYFPSSEVQSSQLKLRALRDESAINHKDFVSGRRRDAS